MAAVQVVQLPPAFWGEQAVYGPHYRGGLAPPPDWWAQAAQACALNQHQVAALQQMFFPLRQWQTVGGFSYQPVQAPAMQLATPHFTSPAPPTPGPSPTQALPQALHTPPPTSTPGHRSQPQQACQRPPPRAHPRAQRNLPGRTCPRISLHRAILKSCQLFSPSQARAAGRERERARRARSLPKEAARVKSGMGPDMKTTPGATRATSTAAGIEGLAEIGWQDVSPVPATVQQAPRA